MSVERAGILLPCIAGIGVNPKNQMQSAVTKSNRQIPIPQCTTTVVLRTRQYSHESTVLLKSKSVEYIYLISNLRAAALLAT